MVTQPQFTQTSRLKLTERVVDAKAQKGLVFQQLENDAGLSLAFVTAAIPGNMLCLRWQRMLSVSVSDCMTPHQSYCRRSAKRQHSRRSADRWTIYRFHEMVQIYGCTFKALVHELFGDGIISAINFKVDPKKIDDPEGGSRAVSHWTEFLPAKPY